MRRPKAPQATAVSRGRLPSWPRGKTIAAKTTTPVTPTPIAKTIRRSANFQRPASEAAATLATITPNAVNESRLMAPIAMGSTFYSTIDDLPKRIRYRWSSARPIPKNARVAPTLR